MATGRSSPESDGKRRWSLPRRLAVTAVCLAGGGAALLFWVVQVVLPNALVRPSRAERYTLYANVTPEGLGLQAEDMWVEAGPHLFLRGWFIYAQGPAAVHPRGTVLLIHGSSSCKESMLGIARLFAGDGYNALAFDMRAHGESGGTYRTFGYYEKFDCARILDEAVRRFGECGPFAVYGDSMGGAIALQFMAVDPRVRCGIVTSTFASLREIAQDYLRQIAHVPLPLVANLAIPRADRLARFSVDAVRPEQAAESIEQPVLLVHGTDDQQVSIRYGERIFHHLHAGGCEWDAVSGGTHGNLWAIGGEAYARRVLDFLEAHDR